MSQFDTGLPSIREIQSFIKNKQKVEIGVIMNDTLGGQILWQDQNCLCLVNEKREKTLVWIQSIAYIKPESSESSASSQQESRALTKVDDNS